MNYNRFLRLFIFLITAQYSFHCVAEEPRLINHAIGDVSSSFGGPAILLVGGVIATSFSHPLDDNVQNYFSNNRFSKKFDTSTNWIANPYILSGSSVLLYGSSLLTHNEKFQRTSETLVESLIYNAVMTESLKLAFRRTRPNGGNYSFPSGHTSTAFTIASVLQNMEGWQYGLPAYTAASIIAFSRIDGNYHYLSDVVFGAALGSCIGWGTSIFHQKEDSKLMISPILDQTRGIMLSYEF